MPRTTDAANAAASQPQIIPDHRLAAAARGALRWRWLLAVIAAVIFAVAYPASNQLRFDRSIGSMFAADDPTLIAYQQLSEAFGGNVVVMLVYRDDELFTSGGLRRNAELSRQVQQVAGVRGVLSVSVLNQAVEKIRPGSLFGGGPGLLRNDPTARGFVGLLAGYTHAADRSRGAIVAMLDPDHRPQTIESLLSIAQSLPTPLADGALVGEPVLVHDGFELIERDGARLATLTVTLLSIVVVISLFDLRFVILTAAVIGWSVVVTKATMVWWGMHLSLVSTILTAIVTVITVAAVLHLGVRFRIARGRGHSAADATVAALTALVIPIMWTCATDAAGFLALAVSRILPVQQFGWMIAIASAAVFIGVILIAPAVMMLPGWSAVAALDRPQRAMSRWLRRRCLRLANAAVRHPKTCLTVSAVCLIIALAGVGQAETETSFLNNFRADSPVVQSYQSVENNFGGAGVWDVVLPAPTKLSADYLEAVRALERDLRKIDVDGARLTKVLSLADAELIASRAPLLRFVSPASRMSGMQLTMPVFFDALLTPPQGGGRQLRIMLRSDEHLGAEQKLALIAAVQSVVDRHTSSGWWQAADTVADVDHSEPQVTGYYVMMARLVSQLVGDQWRCFAASGLLVWILLIFASGSLRLATAALLPNLLPVFLVLGLVGLAGGKINMGAAMIAAVSIGLSIDGSVHFLAAYRRYRWRGHGATPASIHAAGKIGVPVFLATIALVVGFGALVTSEFIPTATFGALVAATLVLGTMVNLTCLPAMVNAWAVNES